MNALEILLFSFIGVIIGLAIKRYLKQREWKWIGNDGDHVVMWYLNLAEFRGWVLRLHWIVQPDKDGCFHTHPARCWRLPFWGGYKEEVWPDGDEVSFIHFFGGEYRLIRLWRITRIDPSYCHRVHSLNNGKGSMSLWLMSPRTQPVVLRGTGWPPEMMPLPGTILDLPTKAQREEIARIGELERFRLEHDMKTAKWRHDEIARIEAEAQDMREISVDDVLRIWNGPRSER